MKTAVLQLLGGKLIDWFLKISGFYIEKNEEFAGRGWSKKLATADFWEPC